MERKMEKAFTHGGVFHADDIFATALLQCLNPDIKIFRGFQVPDAFDGIVYDIGFGEYDHHQKNRRVRSNGIPYAAFGLLWEAFGARILGEAEAKKFDEEFVQPLDLSDNTGQENILSRLISDRNLTWKESGMNNETRFFETVKFAREILEYRFSQILTEKEAFQIVAEKVQNTGKAIIHLEKPMPWNEAVKNSECIYVIYPSARGGYNIQAVPDDEDKTKLKMPFPEQWRGKTASELRKITHIKGLNFCHMSGFLCAADTLDDAYKVAELAIKR